MNEQQLADLFSEQLDRLLLQGDTDINVPDIDDLPELFDFSTQLSKMEFQPSPAAQAAFQSQVAGWFGPTNGAASTGLFGLSKVWLMIITVAIVGMTGIGLIIMMVTSVIVVNSGNVVNPATAIAATVTTGTPAATVSASSAVTGTPVTTVTVQPTITSTVTVTPSATAVVTSTPGMPAPPNIVVLKFKTILNVPVMCQGAYQTQQVLVNDSGAPVDDAVVVWDVVEGADLVETVDILSSHLAESPAALAANVTTTAPAASNFANLATIAGHEEVKLDIKVKVNDKWWKQPDGTKIKVKLSISHKLELDHNDDDDDSVGLPGHSQTIVIVKQGAQWITIKGRMHQYGDQKFLVDGRIVVINSCTGFPPQLPPGSDVEIIAIILPDGTISVINIIIVNINVVVIDLDSGVPTGGSSGGGSGGDGGNGAGGGSSGGGRGGGSGGRGGGSGGSRGGGSGGS